MAYGGEGGFAMAEWSKKFSLEAIREIISHIVWSYWPIWGAPLISGLLAATSDYNAAEVFNFALFAFAMIVLALNNFSQWTEARSAAGKVNVIVPVVGIKMDDTVDPPRLHGLKFGALLRSAAPFPIEIRIDDLQTQIGDRVPTEAFYVRSVTVGRGAGAQFTNGLIDLSSVDRANKVIEGHISVSATYGKPGELKYPAEQQWKMTLKFDKDGNFEGAEPTLAALIKKA